MSGRGRKPLSQPGPWNSQDGGMCERRLQRLRHRGVVVDQPYPVHSLLLLAHDFAQLALKVKVPFTSFAASATRDANQQPLASHPGQGHGVTGQGARLDIWEGTLWI